MNWNKRKELFDPFLQFQIRRKKLIAMKLRENLKKTNSMIENLDT